MEGLLSYNGVHWRVTRPEASACICSCLSKRGNLQTKRFPADSVEVGQRNQIVVCKPASSTLLISVANFLSKLVLDHHVLGKEVECAREGVGSGVHGGEDESAARQISMHVDIRLRGKGAYEIWPTSSSSVSLSACDAFMLALTGNFKSWYRVSLATQKTTHAKC